MSSSDELNKLKRGYGCDTHSLSGLAKSDGQTAAAQTGRVESPQSSVPSRLMDFAALTKPEVLFMVVLSTGAGSLMASGPVDLLTLFNAMLGTALVAGGTAALNHYMERRFDGEMRRTSNRPLPAGRLRPDEALRFGLALSIAGTIYLAATCNFLTSAIGVAALLSYLLLYTPLKRRSDLCTLVGAFPGAAPILMGWTAVRGDLTFGGWILYAILFFWQFPHFLAIGWTYREDYARANMLMIPEDDPDGSIAFRRVWMMSAALIVLSFFPAVTGMAGAGYFVTAAILAVGLLLYAGRAWSRRSNASTRQLLLATVIYLPLLLLAMVADKNPLYRWVT
jgi:protoheme IX farnesyltransferase